MSDLQTFLVHWYPVHPHSEMNIYQLDCLKPEYMPPISKFHYNTVKEYVQEFITYALCRHIPGHNRGLIWHYNNSAWFIAEAKNIFEFIDKFREELKKRPSAEAKVTEEEFENLMRILDGLNVYEQRPCDFYGKRREKH